MCPDCLKNEFSAAARMDASEVESYRVKQAAAAKRQHARMAKLLESYKNGTMFNMSGKIMFCVGLFILLFCHLIFFLDGLGMIYWGVDGMDTSGKTFVSMSMSVVCVLLLIFSTRRFKFVMLLASAIILVMGWLAPGIWKASPGAAGGLTHAGAIQVDDAEAAVSEPVTQEEMAVFYELKKNYPRVSHYAVFLNNHDPAVRDLMRESLTRLLNAEYTRAYTCSNGVLYVVANAACARNKVSAIVERLGRIVKSDIEQGIYLVQFDSEKTNLVCKYSTEVLSSPLNPSFVTANISELQCLDSMRIRVAARSLRHADVQILRTEIRDALVKTLRDSWVQDQDTYVALIDALVTYAPAKDRECVEICFTYFSERYAAKKEVLPSVVDLLIKEEPEKMVMPVIDYWLGNSMVWAQQMRDLSWRVQPKLLERMEGDISIKDLNLILRYLQENGNEDAIPAVKKLLSHSDSIVRYTAQMTVNAIEARAAEEMGE